MVTMKKKKVKVEVVCTVVLDLQLEHVLEMPVIRGMMCVGVSQTN